MRQSGGLQLGDGLFDDGVSAVVGFEEYLVDDRDEVRIRQWLLMGRVESRLDDEQDDFVDCILDVGLNRRLERIFD